MSILQRGNIILAVNKKEKQRGEIIMKKFGVLVAMLLTAALLFTADGQTACVAHEDLPSVFGVPENIVIEEWVISLLRKSKRRLMRQSSM